MTFYETHINNEIKEVLAIIESLKDLNEENYESKLIFVAKILSNLTPFYKKLATNVKIFLGIKNSESNDKTRNTIAKVFSRTKTKLLKDLERIRTAIDELNVELDFSAVDEVSNNIDKLEKIIDNHHWAK